MYRTIDAHCRSWIFNASHWVRSLKHVHWQGNDERQANDKTGSGNLRPMLSIFQYFLYHFLLLAKVTISRKSSIFWFPHLFALPRSHTQSVTLNTYLHSGVFRRLSGTSHVNSISRGAYLLTKKSVLYRFFLIRQVKKNTVPSGDGIVSVQWKCGWEQRTLIIKARNQGSRVILRNAWREKRH